MIQREGGRKSRTERESGSEREGEKDRGETEREEVQNTV